MKTRQATIWLTLLLALLFGLFACAPSEPTIHLQTATPTTVTPTQATFTALPPTVTATATLTPPPTSSPCLTQPGRIESGALETTNPAQEYFIYLPPCYAEQTDKRYAVLYLLHGQTYTDDQWIRLGVPNVLDDLIHSGESQPFIVVFPDDRYWNLPPGGTFGPRLVENLIPYIDSTYRTLPDRGHRAIGGMSRGAGWAFQLGFTRWDLFSVIGLHSLVVFQGEGSQLEKWIADIPLTSLPAIFMDIGDNDQELNTAIAVDAMLTENGVAHEWHRYGGAHTEEYWRAHVKEYIEWYAEQWDTTP